MARFAVILPAAGSSTRFDHPYYKKPFAPLRDQAIWLHSANKFVNRSDVCQTIVVVAPEDEEEFLNKFEPNLAFLEVTVALGGRERADSVANALRQVTDEADYVAVHDAARPLVAEKAIDQVFQEAQRTGAAILATSVVGTLKRVTQGQLISETVPRHGLWEAQTPQVFQRSLLEQAYASRGKLTATDDAQLVEQLGHPVTIVEGSRLNFKITTQDDLRLAEVAFSLVPKPTPGGGLHPFDDDDHWR